MGIQGLLPFLKKASRPTSIKEFKGCTVAIDSYCWLHKGAFSCAEKLAKGEDTDQYVYYCLKYVNNLLSMGIKPIMVFDGGHLPSKRDVEKARRERREKHRKLAAQFMREGKRAEARDALTKCIDITPKMALDLMNACRDKGVDCIVAPYEADAQLAYLSKTGIAQVIITEDSDLILFGCERIMFKMDVAGNGMLIEKRNLNQALDMNAQHYTFDKFRYMCILSGCDYLPSLPGIGLGKASKVFKISRQTDMNLVLRKLPATLKMASLSVPLDYVEGFFKANNTFLYQLVFDPMKRQLVPLNPYPPDIEPDDVHYAGPPIPQSKAYQVALGNIDHYTGKQIADFNPDTFKPKSQSWHNNPHGKAAKDMLHMLSIWNPAYRPMPNSNFLTPLSAEEGEGSQLGQTAGKAITVALPAGLVRKLSPVKKRKAEPEETLENSGLLTVYDNTDTDNAVETVPELDIPATRPREETVPDRKKPRLSLAEEWQQETEDLKKGASPERSRLSEGSSPVRQPAEEPVDILKRMGGSPKVNSSPAPSKNKFAIGSNSAKKNRFSLNAKKDSSVGVVKEVKSRFFTAKKPMKSTNFFGELARGYSPKPDEESSSAEDEDSSTEDGENRNNDKDTTYAVRTDSKTSNLASNSQPSSASSQQSKSIADSGRNSPYGSFTFSKLNQFRSSFDVKRADVPVSSSALEQFKSVRPKPQGSSSQASDTASQSPSQKRTSSSWDCDDFETVPSDTQENAGILRAESNQSLALSTNEHLDTTDVICTGSSRSSLDVIVLDDNCESPNNRDPESTPDSAQADSGYRSGGSRQSLHRSSSAIVTLNPGSVSGQTHSSLKGCRPSGLSKPPGGSTKKRRSDPGKGKRGSKQEDQPKLTNFLSGFTFSKGPSEKLPPAVRKPLSPNKSNIMANFTPDTDSHITMTTHSGSQKTQRRLELN